MSPSQADYLRHILDEIDFVLEQHSETTKQVFLRDETTKRAYVRSLEIIGEATKNLPVEVRERHRHVYNGGVALEVEFVTGEGHSMNASEDGSTHISPDTAMRNLESISPFFIVKDLQVAISHYVERFGFALDFQGPDDHVYYAHVSRDGIGIMLKTITPEVLPQPNHTRHPWARWDAYIYTLDPDPLFAEFERRGASFVKELSYIDDGLWGFEVTDADGYVLAFFRARNA